MGNDEGSFRFLADPGSSTTQEGDWYLARLTQCEPCVVLMDPLEESLLCPLSVTWLSPRSGGGPAPGLWGSLTRLFPRYVQEVIQRGRSCVRPACTPMLSVVPAVSDMELSETEYVRPPRAFPHRPPSPRCGPGLKEQQLFRGREPGHRTGRAGAASCPQAFLSVF